MDGEHEAGTFWRQMLFEFGMHAGHYSFAQIVLGIGGAHHALLKIVKTAERHRQGETPFGHRFPIAASGQGLVQSGLCCGTHHAFVIEYLQHLVEGAINSVHGWKKKTHGLRSLNNTLARIKMLIGTLSYILVGV